MRLVFKEKRLYKLIDIDKIVEEIIISNKLLSISLPILLFGDMGVGKTTFTKVLISKLIDIKKISYSSPTFGIINHYDEKGVNIYHSDLSRLMINDQVLQSKNREFKGDFAQDENEMYKVNSDDEVIDYILETF